MDQRLLLTNVPLELVTEVTNVGHRVGFVVPLARGDAPQAIRRPGRALAEHERIVHHPDVEAVARLDPQASPCFAWDGDLVL
jgi:hypothetical protein